MKKESKMHNFQINYNVYNRYERYYDLRLERLNTWKCNMIRSQYVEVPRDQIRNVELKSSSCDNLCAISTIVENNNFHLLLTNQDFYGK